MSKFKKLTEKQETAVATGVKILIHAGRDEMRSIGKYDTTKVPVTAFGGHFGEAFGIMHGLHILGYGDFESCNIHHPEYSKWNLKWWYAELQAEVLKEENFESSNECDHCLERYNRDAVRRKLGNGGILRESAFEAKQG